MKPLRTALFAPGNRPDRVEKALGLGADVAGQFLSALVRGDVIILERPALASLKIGQTVVFMSETGIPVAHVVVSHSPRGWVTRGLNNDECDPGTLRDSIYMGVVVKAFHPTDSPILAYWKTSPQNVYASNP